jgi:hypothetical protein
MDTAIKAPLSSRINFRLVGFVTVMMLLVGYPLYQFADEAISGGIKNHGDYAEVNLKAMSNFSFDQINGRLEDIPPQWRQLDGKRVQLIGEMWQPNVAAGKIQNFELVYSIAKCCFSGPPQIQHFVQANVEGDRKVGYYDGLVKVTGTLHVNVTKGPDGKVASVYQLSVENVQPANS